MRGHLLISIVSAAGFISAPAASFAKDKDEPVVLEPATVWSLDYAEEKCRLARAFGEGDDRHMIFFEQSGPSSSFGLTIAGSAFDRFRVKRKTMVQFGAAGEPMETNPFVGTLGEIGQALIYSAINFDQPNDDDKGDGNRIDEGDGEKAAAQQEVKLYQIDSEQAAAVDFISFSQRGRVVIAKTSNLEAPMKALNDCAHAFVTEWGLDLEQHRTATRLPVWTNQRVIASRIAETYPSSALNRGQQGIVRMRVIVDEIGGVSDCHLYNATDSDALNSPACRDMRRAIFKPALDADGKPMRSFYMTTINYQMS